MKQKLLSPGFRPRNRVFDLFVMVTVITALFNHASAQIKLVKDLNTGPHIWYDSPLYGNAVEVNGTFYFIANKTLWKKDETIGKNVPIKKFFATGSMIAYNNAVYLAADDGIDGLELWKSDGTEEGTIMLKDISPGFQTSAIQSFTIANNLLFFLALNDAHGRELWRTNGTPDGTVMVRDIIAGPQSSNPRSLVAFSNRLFFVATDGLRGNELWTSNGSSAEPLLDIRPGKASSTPENLTVSGSNLYFHAMTDTDGRELWKTDGTVPGTRMVKAIRPGVNTSGPRFVVNLNGTVYFSMNDNVHGTEFWRTDGTEEGTELAFDLKPGSDSGIDEWVHSVVAANGKLYINRQSNILESDATVSGTRIITTVRDFYNGVDFYVNNDIVYFVDYIGNYDEQGNYENEYWLNKIENSAPSTIKFLGTLPESISPSFTSAGVIFPGRKDDGSIALWRSDGTPEGSVPFYNVRAQNGGSEIGELVQLNGNVIFRGNDSLGGALWTMDGTTTNVQLLKRMYGEDFTISGTRLYFNSDWNLWKSNGTAEGTILVKKFGFLMDPHFKTDVNGTLFFSAADANGGRELWKSNGNFAGTVRVKDIIPGPQDSDVDNLMNVNGTLYFSARHPTHGNSLWKSDGTDAGTVVVRPSNPAYAFTFPRKFVTLNNQLFFVATNPTTGVELYKTDGTAGGTVLLKDIVTVNDNTQADLSYYDDIGFPVARGNRFYFSAKAQDLTWDLWSSDGTTEGTRKLIDVPATGIVNWYQVVNGKMVFSLVTTSPAETKLYTTDGTASGTEMIKVIPATDGTMHGVVLANVLYFNGGVRNIWRTDGSECGTFIVETGDEWPLRFPSFGGMVINKDRRIVFEAVDHLIGGELYKLDKADAPESPCGTVSATAENSETVLEERSIEKIIVNYPNPFTNNFNLRVNSSEHQTFDASILTINGKEVSVMRSLETNTGHAIGTQLQSGIYLMKVMVGKRTEIRRVVKVN